MTEAQESLRWGMERRLEFIEFRLFWEGHVNRSDLMDTFKISVAQATTDLNRYLALAPGNMAYDKSAKAYVRTPEFKARFQEPESGRYLNQLRSVADGIVEPGKTWIERFPPFDVTPTLARTIDPIILRSIVDAIRRKKAVEIKYQSFSRPEPRWRWIAPHALAHDGFRWHARAFCETDHTFKDFLLARMMELRGTRPAEVDPAADRAWHEHVMLEITPHPALSKMQQKIIARDYDMQSGKAKIKVRRALLYYTLKRLGLDTDPRARRPQDQQIVLLNRDILPSVVQAAREEG